MDFESVLVLEIPLGRPWVDRRRLSTKGRKLEVPARHRPGSRNRWRTGVEKKQAKPRDLHSLRIGN